MDTHLIEPQSPRPDEYLIGLDIGGTKLLGIVTRPGAQIVIRSLAPTPKGNQAVAEAAIHIIADLLAAARETGIRPAGIGVGAPGYIDVQNGVIINADNLEVDGLNLKAILEEHFHLPARIAHDVRSAALAEACFGAGQGRRDFAFLNLGTGVSVGLFLDGRVYHGAGGKAGELGQVYLRPSQPGQEPLPEERLEGRASGPALVRQAAAALQAGEPSLLLELADRQPARLSPQMIAQAARTADPLSLRLIAAAADILGEAVGGMLNLLGLECVIVGGGMAGMGEVLLDPLRTAVRRYLLEECREAVTILPSTLGGEAGAIGAAAYFNYGG